MNTREDQLKRMYPDVRPCESDDNAFDREGKPRGQMGTILRRKDDHRPDQDRRPTGRK